MKTLFITDDGKQFDSEKEAKKHENELFEETRRKKIAEQEKQAHLDDIQRLYDSLMSDIDDFIQKYPNDDIKINDSHISSKYNARDFLFDFFSML